MTLVENYLFLTNFTNFSQTHPTPTKNVPKMSPCLEDFGPKTYSFGLHILISSPSYVSPRRLFHEIPLLMKMFA